MSKLLNKNGERVSNIVSCSVTWIDGRAIFKDDKKHSKAYYGICSFYQGVFALTPLDWEKVKMITTIKISPAENFCERAYSCLATNCPLNRFDRDVFAAAFSDCSIFSLGLPNSFNKENSPWFDEGKWKTFWSKFILPITGGRIEYDEQQAKKILQE